MSRFEYTGRSAGGEAVSGSLEAASAAAAADTLLSRGVTPLNVAAVDTEGAAFDVEAWLKEFFKEKVPDTELMLFSRQLHTLLRAGVPIMRALLGLQESCQHKTMMEVIRDVRERLEQGRDLSACLARHPKVFYHLYVSMVRVGETTGRLDEIFLRLYHHIEFEKMIREQVKAALRYPTMVVFAMAGAILAINLFVIPAFSGVYASFNAELPLMTRILVAFSNFMVAWWHAMVGGGFLAWMGFKRYTKDGPGRLAWDRIKLKIPIIGKVIHKATLSRFARSFALGLTSGVPITQAMKMVAQTVDNDYIASRIEQMREGVERGDTVLRTAIASGVFTPVVLQMIAVGEESGALDELLGEIAELYGREVEYEIKTLASQIEPILVGGMAVLVLILAMGIFLPIWDLGKTVMQH
ncbi:MAG: type II secretion system F family protein [Rhodocyclaceae bacterium]|nr:type II secretion system F family protein [Rhodocyclaceae bacterium]